jgi:hypothetical protein
LLLSAVFSSPLLAADEPDNRTPVARYQGDAEFSILTCKIGLRIAIAKTNLGEQQDEKSDYLNCIQTGKATAKKNLDAALKSVKKAKAKEALKSHYVVLVGALDGIRPGSDERKASYEQRQQALEGKLTEAWARFEVER